MFKKIVKFLRYPKEVKIDRLISIMLRLRLSCGYFISNTYAISDLPISISRYNSFPQIKKLYKSFIKYNNIVNNGDLHRLVSFILNIEKVLIDDCVKGDLAELGVWKGNTASLLAYYAKKENRKCYLFDTFEGFDPRDLNGKQAKFDFSDTSIDVVRDVIGDDLQKSCIYCKGYFPQSIPEELETNIFSVVSLDADLYAPMKAGLDWFFPRMSNGGLFLLHDYSSKQWDECRKAIDEFCTRENQNVILMPDKYGSAFIRINK
jgi:hypothetical protein